MNDYDISALIPVYNTDRFIRESIESVLDQTFPPVEIVVFDDGSTDGSANVVKSFGDRVRYLGPERVGFVVARNRLVSEARCDWIAFQDADDIWTADKLEKQVAYLRESPGIEACLGLAEQFLEPGCEAPSTVKDGFFEEATAQFYIQNLLASREVFSIVGDFLEDALGPDSDWFARAKDRHVSIGVVNEVLFRRRWHDSNISNDFHFKSAMLDILRRSINRKKEEYQ